MHGLGDGNAWRWQRNVSTHAITRPDQHTPWPACQNNPLPSHSPLESARLSGARTAAAGTTPLAAAACATSYGMSSWMSVGRYSVYCGRPSAGCQFPRCLLDVYCTTRAAMDAPLRSPTTDARRRTADWCCSAPPPSLCRNVYAAPPSCGCT
jgi:hypothetical protein